MPMRSVIPSTGVWSYLELLVFNTFWVSLSYQQWICCPGLDGVMLRVALVSNF